MYMNQIKIEISVLKTLKNAKDPSMLSNRTNTAAV
jgi:hypothetical protein